MPYDTLKDFTPISLISTGDMLLLVHPASPITSVKGLIARAKAEPGRLNYEKNGAAAKQAGLKID